MSSPWRLILKNYRNLELLRILDAYQFELRLCTRFFLNWNAIRMVLPCLAFVSCFNLHSIITIGLILHTKTISQDDNHETRDSVKLRPVSLHMRKWNYKLRHQWGVWLVEMEFKTQLWLQSSVASHTNQFGTENLNSQIPAPHKQRNPPWENKNF